MKTLADPDRLLGEGLAELRERFAVPQDFPPAVIAEAEEAARRPPAGLADWTQRPFVTLDPATSTDLDQAFCIERAGGEFLLHYALADIGWFAPDGGAGAAEAWRRGVTLYLPDGKARLYPSVLSECAASLLPNGSRPAIVVTVRCAADGALAIEGATRGLIHSRAKLAYDTVDTAAIPHFDTFAARMAEADRARGAARVDPPEQEIARETDGRFRLLLRPRHPSETANASLSLATNIAIAQAMHAAGTGLFREMPAPDERAVTRLRQIARGLRLDWPAAMPLARFEATIDPRTDAGAAFELAVRRAGGGADYHPWRAGHRPFHAAIGAEYCHATAPMRRLADRYVLDTVLALASGTAPPPPELFARLAEVMNAADARESAIERAVLDLAEAALLHGYESEVFAATVTERDERGAKIMLREWPVLTRVDTGAVASGEEITVRLLEADPVRGVLRFERVR